MKRLFLALAILSLGLPSVVQAAQDATEQRAATGDTAAQIEMGERFYERTFDYTSKSTASDYKSAEYWWLMAAEAGSAEAQYLLAKLYEGAISTGPAAGDRKKARGLYLRAAEAGHAKAQYRLGELSLNYPSDKVQAAAWFRRAAESGHAEAQVKVGEFYLSGYAGYTRDATQTELWWRKAAEAGNAEAQFLLGWLYHSRHLGDADHAQALMWEMRAADQGHPRARSKICDTLLAFDPQRASPYCGDSANTEARATLTLAGLAYANGWDGKPVDGAKAVDFLSRAEGLGEPVATATLGRFRYEGHFLPQDYHHSAELFLKAMERGSAEAAWWMGVQYANGQGVEVDETEANRLRWIALAMARMGGIVPDDMRTWGEQHPEINSDWMSANTLKWWDMPEGTWTVTVVLGETSRTVDAARYYAESAEAMYPERALDDEVEGDVYMNCRWDNWGRPENCVISETPKGYGFAKATMKLHSPPAGLDQKDEWIRLSHGKFANFSALWRF